MSDSLSYLPSLFTSASGASDALLNALYGQSGSAQTGQAALQALANAERNQTQLVTATAAQPAVERAVADFASGVRTATSVKDLLGNKAVMDVLLTANGLGDQTGYTALAKAALTSDVNDPASLVNKLSDTRWKALAGTYRFATQGLAAIKSPVAIAAIGKAYAQTVWEKQQDQVTPGLANALAFRSLASSVTSVDQILGDPTLRTVVTTALGIPQQIAFQSLQAQEKSITDRLDISKLKDPHFVESFTQRYLIANAQNTAGSLSGTPDLTTLAAQAGGILV